MPQRHAQPVRQGGLVDPPRHAELHGQERLAVARVDVVDAEQEAAAPDLAHHLHAGQRRLELVTQRGTPRSDALHQPVVDEAGVTVKTFARFEVGQA